MGVLHADRLIEYFRRGLYNHRPASYVISVDGELIRYKGMISANMTQHNAEEAVSNTSYEYLVRTIMWIETYFGRCAREVIVYMDGTRVVNKTTARPECALDVSLIRSTFMRQCAEHGYRVCALEHGESELQMYLKRDRNVDLNIMLTRDSDMLSICYGHEATYICEKAGETLKYADIAERGLVASTLDWIGGETSQNDSDSGGDDDDEDDSTFGVNRRGTATVDLTSVQVTDINSDYVAAEKGVRVLDSCLWIVCGSSSKPMQFVGFDACAHRIGYNDTVFRTFIAMCGTDFTDAMLTPSMFTGFFSAAKTDEKRYINSISRDVCKTVASVLYMGLKGGGEIKRGLGNQSFVTGTNQFNPYDVLVSISMYYDYISTGNMANKRIPKFNTALAVKHFVYAMRGGVNDRFVKRELVNWANSVPLYECLMNLDAHLGTYNPAKTKKNHQPPTPQKRSGRRVSASGNEKRRLPSGEKYDDSATFDFGHSEEPFVHYLADTNQVLRSVMADLQCRQTDAHLTVAKAVKQDSPAGKNVTPTFVDLDGEGEDSSWPASRVEPRTRTTSPVFELDDY